MLATAPIIMPYSSEQLISLLPTVVFHYTFLSGLLKCLEFPIEATGEVSAVVC